MTFRKPLLTSFILTLAGAVNATELRISVDQIKNDQGTVYAQLFLGEENYKNNVAEDNAMMPAKTETGQFTFKNLKPGDYVIRLFHDENGNQQMDTNAFGMPTEGYGFSNEAVGNMGPPQYKDMVVSIKATEATVTTKAKMTYL